MNTRDKYRFRQTKGGWVCIANTQWGEVKFIFTQRGFDLLIRNYRLGKCHLTDKGLWRYSLNQITTLGELRA